MYKAILYKSHLTALRFYVERQTITAATLPELQSDIAIFKNAGYTLAKVYNPRGLCIYNN